LAFTTDGKWRVILEDEATGKSSIVLEKRKRKRDGFELKEQARGTRHPKIFVEPTAKKDLSPSVAREIYAKR
jgi:hypothetical protein